MNIKIVYPDRIDVWDTRADGSASTSHAVLRVKGKNLELWSDLKFEEGYDPEKSGQAKSSRTEEGRAESILNISAENAPRGLKAWLAVAHDESGLLRFDIDGETFYEYEEEPIEEGDDVLENATQAQPVAVFDPKHPTKAGLDAALKQKFGY